MSAEHIAAALGGRRSGNGWIARCPAHEDREPSLSLAERDGHVLVRCHAGCEQRAVIEALARRGIWPAAESRGLTVAELARTKGLPEALMRESGYADDTWRDAPCIRIDYRDAAGAVISVRYRGADGRRWSRRGDRAQLYGLWRLRREPVLLVEGETDCIALWAAGLNAVGVPGASAWRDDRFAAALDGCPTIYVHVEPDEGGEALRAALARSRLRERVRYWTVAPAAKDPCELRARDPAGFPAAVAALIERAEPPAQTADGATVAAEPDGEVSPRARRSQASELVELCAGLDLWRADDEPYACAIVEDHRETWPLRSRAMRALLARMYYRAHARAPGRQALEDALDVLAGRALHEGEARTVHVRVAESGGAIYVDLCDARWRAIEIDAAGWRIVDRPPVYFVRRRGMLPLPEPVHGGSLAQLVRHLAARDERDVRAIVGWLVQAYRPRGPYPVLILAGEQGAGKSLTARLLRALIDPSVAPIRAAPRDERDLVIAARNGWIVALDNLSGAAPWLSDALCRIATGGGMSTRELYSDCDEVLIDVQRPICANGIDAIATRPDLADRSVIVTLEPIPEERRRPEAEIVAAFEREAPAIIGALCDVVACAIRRLPAVRLARLPRMADHAVWIEAASPALGWPAGRYVAEYCAARDEIVGSAAEESPVGVAIMALVDRHGPWSGTATALLAALTASVGPEIARGRAWPATPRALANAVARIAPALRARGYRIDRTRSGHDGHRTYDIGRHAIGHNGHRPSAPSAPSASTPPDADGADGTCAADGTLHLCPSRVGEGPEAAEVPV